MPFMEYQMFLEDYEEMKKQEEENRVNQQVEEQRNYQDSMDSYKANLPPGLNAFGEALNH